MDIYHLLYANEYSEAGKIYNQDTLEFIVKSFNYFNNLKSFDAIESIKDRFEILSEEILEKNEKNKKVTKESFDNSEPNIIRLKDKKEIILKKCLIDELGVSNLKSNGFEPKYNYYEKDNKIIINVEVPGGGSIKEEIGKSNEYHVNVVKINGIKKNDEIPEKSGKNLFNTREFGPFFLDIPITYELKDEKAKISSNKGIITLEYNLAEIRKPGEFDF